MTWQEEGNYVTANVGPGAPTRQAMTDFCNCIVKTVIPRNAGIPWDCLRVELWPDSGRIIAFPSSSSKSERLEKSGCVVVFSDLLAEYERLADSELDDEEFTRALTQTEMAWMAEFLSAASEVLRGHRVQFWSGDFEQPVHDEWV